MTIPSSPADVTPEWLTSALLGTFGETSVATVHTTTIGTGQMGDTYRIQATYPENHTDLPDSLVLKIAASDASSLNAARALRSYEIECAYYAEIAETVDARSPRCYSLDFDPETHSFYLLLEDLSPASVGDQIAGTSADRAALVIDEMVRLHAPRCGDKKLENLEWLNQSGPETTMQISAVAAMVLPGFEERFGDRLSEDHMALYRRLSSDLAKLLNAELPPRTVTHGDYRLDNLLFFDEGHPEFPGVGVVDFQGAGLGPPTIDLAYFIGSGLLTDERREVEWELVAKYHGAMAASGVTGLSLSDVQRAYRLGSLAGMTVTLVASMLVTRTGSGRVRVALDQPIRD